MEEQTKDILNRIRISIANMNAMLDEFEKELFKPKTKPEKSELKASDFACLGVDHTNTIAFLMNKYKFVFTSNGVRAFIDFDDFTRKHIDSLINVTETTYDQLQCNDKFWYMAGFPIVDNNTSYIGDYYILREDGMFYGNEEGAIHQVPLDTIEPFEKVYKFEIK